MKWKSNIASFFVLLFLSGCSLDQMQAYCRLRPYENTKAFADASSARLPVPGTVARGHAHEDELLYRGEIHGKVSDLFPFEMTRADLERGRSQFNINCSPCHGRTGLGNGMVVARGFAAPPSYFDPRIRSAKVGHFFQVMTDGFGAMAPYAEQVDVKDRWRIAAYIRVLQLSRSVELTNLPGKIREKVTAQTLDANAQKLGPSGRPEP